MALRWAAWTLVRAMDPSPRLVVGLGDDLFSGMRIVGLTMATTLATKISGLLLTGFGGDCARAGFFGSTHGGVEVPATGLRSLGDVAASVFSTTGRMSATVASTSPWSIG